MILWILMCIWLWFVVGLYCMYCICVCVTICECTIWLVEYLYNETIPTLWEESQHSPASSYAAFTTTCTIQSSVQALNLLSKLMCLCFLFVSICADVCPVCVCMHVVSVCVYLPHFFAMWGSSGWSKVTFSSLCYYWNSWDSEVWVIRV